MAERLQARWLENRRRLGVMYAAFTAAALALGTEVILWIVKLSQVGG